MAVGWARGWRCGFAGHASRDGVGEHVAGRLRKPCGGERAGGALVAGMGRGGVRGDMERVRGHWGNEAVAWGGVRRAELVSYLAGGLALSARENRGGRERRERK